MQTRANESGTSSAVRPAPRRPSTPPGSTVRGSALPEQPTPLIGRDRDVDAVRAQLLRSGPRLVTLTAPPGMGKPRLALATAAELAGEFAHGVWFVPLEAIRDPDLVLSVVAHTLGVQERGARPLVETLTDALRDRRLLLVLDNFEQVLAPAPPVCELL